MAAFYARSNPSLSDRSKSGREKRHFFVGRTVCAAYAPVPLPAYGPAGSSMRWRSQACCSPMCYTRLLRASATRVCYARPIRRCLASACDLALAVQNWSMSRWLNSRRSAASSDCLLSATDTSSPTSQFPLTPRKLGLTRTASLRGDFGRLVTRAARLHGYSKAS